MENASSKHITRRSFLATTGLAAGALAASGMAGCSSVDTSGEPAATETVEEKTFINTCRGNCGGSCVLNGRVREGKIVSVEPQQFPKEYEGVSQGCVKGVASPLRLYGTHRLLHPMKRVGERGSGEWEQISWDEAISLIAEKFQAAFDEAGPESVFVWTGAGNSASYLNGSPFNIANWAASVASCGVGISRFAQKTGISMLGNGGDQAGMYMLFYMLGTPKHPVEDFQNAKTVICWGSNPADASLNRNGWYWLCKAREGGAKLITIDPLYSATAAHSDEWVPIRVGTDAALMGAIINYLIENDLADTEYLKAKSVAPLLVKEDGTYVRLSDLGKAESGTDSDVPVVWDEGKNDFVAHTDAVNPALTGVREYDGAVFSTAYDLSMESIRSVTVDFAAEECGISPETIIKLAYACVENKPTFLCIDWGIEHTYNSFRLYYFAALLASVIGNVGLPGGGYSAPNASASSILTTPPTQNPAGLAFDDPKQNIVFTGDWLPGVLESGKWAGKELPVKCLYIQAHNPLDNGNDPLGMVKAWEKIDFIVTAEQFMTTTAHYCDLVLPVAMSWEHEDFNGSFLCQKAIEPAGEALSDFEIWRKIAEAMGYADLYDKTGEEYLREYLDTSENLEAGLGYDVWHERGAIFGDYAYGENAIPETNALGRTQFYIETFMDRDDQGRDVPSEDRLPYYAKAAEAYHDNPAREKYPLFGFSNHEVYHGQSMHAHNAWLDEFRTCDGEPFCRIHPSAAEERGIETGDLVRCYNDHGSVVLKAVVTPGVQEESVWFPHGFFWDEFVEGFAQSLTGLYPDPQTCNANFNDFICQVEKYEGSVA